MKKFLLLGVFTITVFAANAQAKKWTLQECVVYALENNISVKQSELDIKSTELEEWTAKAAFYPTLNLGAGVSESTGLSFNPVTNSPQTATTLSANGSINVGYTLFDGLRNIRQVQRAEISKLASQYRLDKMKDDIALFVANAYLQILLNKANLSAVNSQNAVTKEQIARTEQLVEAGSIPRGDLLEVQATDATELQRIAIAENAVEISLISLAQLLLIKDYQNFDIADDDYQIVSEEILDTPAATLIDSAKENRQEINIAKANVALAEKDIEIARGALMPSVSAFFGYSTRYANNPSFTQSIDPDNPTSIQTIGVVQETGQTVVGEFPNTITSLAAADPFIDQLYTNDGIAYGLSLNVPVFNGFQARANVKRNEINLSRSRLQLEQTALDLESNVYQAIVDAKGSKKAYEAALKAIESQELAYQYAKDRYEVELINAFDFSQSKLRYDNANIEVNRTKYDYIFKLKVLELYFGVDPTQLKF